MAPWAKLFQNLRSTRETELAEQGFPQHVVCAWLGNSPKIANKHYLQVTDAHFEAASTAPTAPNVVQPTVPGRSKVGNSPQPTRANSEKQRNFSKNAKLKDDPDGTRTRVTGVKGRCPRPLDDGASADHRRTPIGNIFPRRQPALAFAMDGRNDAARSRSFLRCIWLR